MSSLPEPIDSVESLRRAAAVVDERADALGGLGVLVNCAGTGISAPVVDTDYDQWREVLPVGPDGPFLCAQRAARRMLAAAGITVDAVAPGRDRHRDDRQRGASTAG